MSFMESVCNEITNRGLKGKWNKLFTREASALEV